VALQVKTKFKEQWLNTALTKFIRKHFTDAGYTVPDNVRLSTGWPSRGALAKKRVLGQAWSAENSADETHEIIISVYLDDPCEVLATLIHEVVHVVVGHEVGHRKPFVDCMKLVGLEGKATATVASDDLKEKIAKWLPVLGWYPHAKLDGSEQKKQSTRMIKMECKECGCVVRTSRKWLETFGDEWPCPCEGVLQEVQPE